MTMNFNLGSDDEVDFLPILPINEGNEDDKEALPEALPILALRNTVLFPGVVLPITVSRDKGINAVTEAYKTDKLIGVVAQKDSNTEDPTAADLERIGTVAKIVKLIKMPDGGNTVIIQGKRKMTVDEITQEDPYFKAKVSALVDSPVKDSKQFEAKVSTIRDLSAQIIQLSPNIPSEASIILKNIESPVFLIHFIANNSNADLAEKQKILSIESLDERAEYLLHILQKELQFAELKNQVNNKTKTEIDKQQREYFLNQQLKSIKDELGGDANDRQIREMKKKAELKNWPDTAKEAFTLGIEKLERMHPSTPDYSVVFNHLELMLDLPWNEVTEDHYDLKNAKNILDDDHYGMHKIKDRILEYLAVLKLKGDMKSPILCFYGPPGIGKTSLGKSIANAIGRKYIRLSLGGLHDESEIRGHRKTYIGAMAGRIIQSIRKAKSSNPVIILDEVDKIGKDFRGDPSSALLEVLDPEQNSTFYDNYLELEYDLSKVLFIATANDISTIQPALRDRLEIIDLNGYAIEEKIEIAKKHLIPKQKEAHGLHDYIFRLHNSTIEKLIVDYTRESGVRELERQLASVMRYLAKEVAIGNEFDAVILPELLQTILGKARYLNDESIAITQPGVAIGLAWTYVGGDILFIETALAKGKGELKLTGNLGNVMKESASTAYTWLQCNAEQYGIAPEAFENNSVHIHIPEGATPKDGPSAGITLTTALVSAFTGRKVRERLAMTGETTLRGEVLPVGGIKEKVLAAKRNGVKEIIMCHVNERDVQEIDPQFIKGVKFHYVRRVEEVIEKALVKK